MTHLMDRFLLLLSEIRVQLQEHDPAYVMDNLHATIGRFAKSDADADRLEGLLFQAMEFHQG